MVTATICLLLALNWGGTRYPWSSPQILGLLGAAVLLFALFIVRIATAAEPFVPLSIMRNRVVAAAIGCACLAYGTMIALTIYAPVYFEVVLGQSASGAGLTLIPFMGGVVVGSTFGGQMMSRLKHYKRVGLVGLPLAAVMLMPLVIFPAQLSIVAVASFLLVAGAGMGTVFPITTVSVQNAVLPWQLGTVTGVINFMRALTSALMVALCGAFLFGAGGQMTLESLVAAGHSAALEGPFRAIFAAAAACLAVSWLFLLAMEERPLRTGVAPDAVAVPAE